MKPKWSTKPIDRAADTVSRYLGVGPIIGQLMVNRGIRTPKEAEAYYTPTFDQLFRPSLMPNAEVAAARIALAIERGEKIVVFGDYDVDGITSSATMYYAIKSFSGNVECYIPHRIEEGYGLNEKAVQEIIDAGAKLIVSVDCGVTAVGPARVAKAAGVDMIITDHHEWQSEFPDCFCIVHPRLPGFQPAYPNPSICGAGVAFKVAWALGLVHTGTDTCDPDYGAMLKRLLAFTALGTIADVVPLMGENRAIAHFGLRELPISPFPGVRALLDSAALGEKAVDGYHVGFCLAPRLNAAGRMGHAKEALELLINLDYEVALASAKELESKNKARQATERRIAQEAAAQAEERPLRGSTVVCSRDWHSGVVGIVASRMVERFYKPALVLVDDGTHIHGSGRSVEGFSLVDVLHLCSEYLLKYGGHAMAAGLKMKSENYEAFRKAFDEYVWCTMPKHLITPKLELDMEIDLTEINEQLVDNMNRMGPFGQGNRRPVFLLKGALIRDCETMGKEGKHLRFQAYHSGMSMKCIAFGWGEDCHKIPFDKLVDIAVEPTVNEWKGNRNVELLVRDILLP